MAHRSDSLASRLPLAGKAVLITGGARRVGATIVRTMHSAGARVAVHYRTSAQEAETLCRELCESRADSAICVQCDLLDTAALERLVNTAAATFGELDILVNNASTFYPTPVGDIDGSDWNDLIGTNLRAPLFLAQAAFPLLRARQGLILNLADIHGLRPLRRHPVYCIAKAGLIMLTKSLARELAPQVRVNAIAPGPVMWPQQGVDEHLKARIIERTALKRGGAPDDIARAALFFACEAPYVTGQILAVDGGRSIGW